MKSINVLLFMILPMFSFSCANVILKNTKTNTVRIARINDLYELGDTVLHDDIKLEVIRKKLNNGTVVRKEPYIHPPLKESMPVITTPTPSITKDPVKVVK
jgi:hypothetical protein